MTPTNEQVELKALLERRQKEFLGSHGWWDATNLAKVLLAEGYRRPQPTDGKLDCEHDWSWSNNAGMYHCNKCNATSYTGQPQSKESK